MTDPSWVVRPGKSLLCVALVVARTSHTCEICGALIEPGETYGWTRSHGTAGHFCRLHIIDDREARERRLATKSRSDYPEGRAVSVHLPPTVRERLTIQAAKRRLTLRAYLRFIAIRTAEKLAEKTRELEANEARKIDALRQRGFIIDVEAEGTNDDRERTPRATH